MKILLFWLAMLAAACRAQDSHCYSHESEPYLHFSSKTAYEFIYDKSKYQPIPHCRPVQFWMLARHGTRNPKTRDIKDMMELPDLRNTIVHNHLMKREGKLCHDDVESLNKWTFDLKPDDASMLTRQGHDDLRFLALRYKAKFAKLLNQTYLPETYEFRYTNSERTKSSAEAFAEGLFGSSHVVHFPTPMDNDPLIKSYENCTAWIRDVQKNPNTYKEVNKFQSGSKMRQLIQSVSERLGFRHKLKINQIVLMYDMCRYDKAWELDKTSAWCSVFTEDELKVLEYREDLKYYYDSGYGNDLNAKVGCLPVKDFIDKFDKVVNATPQEIVLLPAGVFYFSHLTMINMVISRLGIAKDSEPIKHSNYEDMQRRLWKVAEIGPFATNLAIVLFNCTEGEPFRVMFFLGERWVSYEGCDVGLCSWSKIKEQFSDVSQCNLDFCHKKGNAVNIHPTVGILVLVTIASSLTIKWFTF